MATQINPYLSFRDNAREAMEFYQSVFGGELTSSTFAEYEMAQDPADQNKIMHAQLTGPGGLMLMGADTPSGVEYTGPGNVSVSLSGEDEVQLRSYWDKLIEGGNVILPLEKAPWGDSFGMCIDRFAINWLVNVGEQG